MKLRLHRGASTLRDVADRVGALARDVSVGWNVEHTADGRHAWTVVEPGLQTARFKASGSMTWDVDSDSYKMEWYARLGNMLCYNLNITNGTVGGTPATDLIVVLPDGLRAERAAYAPAAFASDTAAAVACLATIVADTNTITITKHSGAAWNTGLAIMDVQLQMWIEVQ